MKLFAFVPALAVLVGSATAFPSFADPSKVDYSAFLEKAAKIKGGQELVKRATNNSGQTGFEQRTFHALINPASFKYNAQEQTVDLTSDEHQVHPSRFLTISVVLVPVSTCWPTMGISTVTV